MLKYGWNNFKYNSVLNGIKKDILLTNNMRGILMIGSIESNLSKSEFYFSEYQTITRI